MTLSLTMMRCPEGVPPQARTVDVSEFAIGRGPENDWVLPDPERYLSKRHCVLGFHAGTWKITDHSTNGTYVNRERAPIGRGHTRILADGDRLHMGTYEIEVRLLSAEMSQQDARASAAALDIAPPDLLTPEHGLDSLLQTRTAVDQLASTRPAPATILPADYDPLAPDPDLDPLGSGQKVVLPEDWDLDTELPGSQRAASGPAQEGDSKLLAAFLRGAGLKDVALPDSAAAMEAAGTILRQAICGLRHAIAAQAKLKSELRIAASGSGARDEIFGASATDDGALAALVSAAPHGHKAPVADALDGIRRHELATLAAIQAAAAALLAELDPARLRETGETGFNLVSAQRKARAWDAFEAQYEQLSRSLADGLGTFGKAFAHAYEQAIAEMAGKQMR